MRGLLATNVVLDLMLKRDPWRVEAEAIADRRLQAHDCASSITDIFTIDRKLVGAQKARRIVRNRLDLFPVVSVTHDLLDAAERQGGSDLEDNRQIACAMETRLEAVVTRDPKGFAGSPVLFRPPANGWLASRKPPIPDADRPDLPKSPSTLALASFE